MKICRHCSTAFEPRRGGVPQVYCSSPCKVKHSNDIWNAKRERLTSRREGTAARLQTFTEDQKQLIFGTLLGDGSLYRWPSGMTRLNMTHAIQQRAYLQWKRDQLAFVFHKEAPNECSKGDSRFLVIGSVCHPWLSEIYPRFYHHGRKHIPDIVLNTMSPLSLAIWYQDDGTYNSNPMSRQATLCSDAYPHKEVEAAADVLRSKFGLRASVYKHHARGSYKTRKGRYARICILRASVPDFFDLVRPHIHPCMAYKIR